MPETLSVLLKLLELLHVGWWPMLDDFSTGSFGLLFVCVIWNITNRMIILTFQQGVCKFDWNWNAKSVWNFKCILLLMHRTDWLYSFPDTKITCRSTKRSMRLIHTWTVRLRKLSMCFLFLLHVIFLLLIVRNLIISWNWCFSFFLYLL